MFSPTQTFPSQMFCIMDETSNSHQKKAEVKQKHLQTQTIKKAPKHLLQCLYISSFVGIKPYLSSAMPSTHSVHSPSMPAASDRTFWSMRRNFRSYEGANRHPWAVTKSPYQAWSRSCGHTQRDSLKHVGKVYILNKFTRSAIFEVHHHNLGSISPHKSFRYYAHLCPLPPERKKKKR